MNRITLMILGLVFMTGCATTNTTTPEDRLQAFLDGDQLEVGESVQSISVFRIRGFNAIDDRQIVLSAGSNKHYLMKMFGNCLGIKSAFGIGFAGNSQTFSRGDSIVYRGTRARPEECPVQEIFELNEQEAES